MGIFSGHVKYAEDEAAIQHVTQKLESAPVIDDILYRLLDEKKYPWMFKGQNYGDNCNCKVVVDRDSILVFWPK